MSSLFRQLPGVLVHIDRPVLYHQSLKKQLEILEKVFQIISNQNLYLKAQNTRLGTTDSEVMGFKIQNGTVCMNPEKVGNALNWDIPTDTKTIRSSLGLCNFFRGHIRDYASISAHLNRLKQKDSTYKGGPMPPQAQEAFTCLKRILCSKPILALPGPQKHYALIVDVSTGAQDFEGGLGAILTQIDKQGQFSVIANPSRLLVTKEKQFSPFLLEMRAMAWATRYFRYQLRGQRFLLFTDHKPLQTSSELTGKSLTKLQPLALEFDFIIQHKKGINMPADFLSQSGLKLQVNAIDLTPNDLASYQAQDFRANGQWPNYLKPEIRKSMEHVETGFTTNSHRRFWVRPTRWKQICYLLYAPRMLRQDIFQGSLWQPSHGP